MGVPRTKRQAERIADQMFNELSVGAQISIMDLSKVTGTVEQLLLTDCSLETAKNVMVSLIAKYRKN